MYTIHISLGCRYLIFIVQTKLNAQLHYKNVTVLLTTIYYHYIINTKFTSTLLLCFFSSVVVYSKLRLHDCAIFFRHRASKARLSPFLLTDFTPDKLCFVGYCSLRFIILFFSNLLFVLYLKSFLRNT